MQKILIFAYFQISTSPRVTMFKNKKDDMSVKSLDIKMKNAQNDKEKITFTCRSFSITGDCSKLPNKECSKDLICLKKLKAQPEHPKIIKLKL